MPSKSKKTNKKRHHYVPKAYLNAFCDESGKLHVYRKDEPLKAQRQTPDNVGFRKYYYSQQTPEGGYNHNGLEDAFSDIEGKWPEVRSSLVSRDNFDDHLETLFAFMALQRTRVPAARDMFEKYLSESVLATAHQLDAQKKLPPPPKGFEDILSKTQVSIDPQQSLSAIPSFLNAVGEVFSRMGFGALYNQTKLPFLTSDNPVVWFDPSVENDLMKPYTLKKDGPVILFFPVTPNLLILGNSRDKDDFAEYGLLTGDLTDEDFINTINASICRFAYEAVFSRDPGYQELVQAHADQSPILKTQTILGAEGSFVFHEMVFGPRSKKPKWQKK